jgi:hypothetical protein
MVYGEDARIPVQGSASQGKGPARWRALVSPSLHPVRVFDSVQSIFLILSCSGEIPDSFRNDQGIVNFVKGDKEKTCP